MRTNSRRDKPVMREDLSKKATSGKKERAVIPNNRSYGQQCLEDEK